MKTIAQQIARHHNEIMAIFWAFISTSSGLRLEIIFNSFEVHLDISLTFY